MHDIDVRQKLHAKLKFDFLNEPGTRIIDELGLCQGASRIDIAVINGLLHGYEIKSESDNLLRLPTQVEMYNKVLDKVTLVCSENHYKKAIAIIPEWWGIISASETNDGVVTFDIIRPAKENSNVDVMSVVQLLWKDELIAIIKSINPDYKISNKNKHELWKLLANTVSKEKLCSLVREKLKDSKYRLNWRSDESPRSNDDLFPLFSM